MQPREPLILRTSISAFPLAIRSVSTVRPVLNSDVLAE
jgi:hypothetical protein